MVTAIRQLGVKTFLRLENFYQESFLLWIKQSLFSGILAYFCLNRKFLVYNMVSRNVKAKYGRSVFGLGWTVLSPILLALMYYFVFKKVMRIEQPNYLAFVLSGIMPWAFFSQSVSEGLDSFVSNQPLVSKIPLPMQVLPLVVNLTNMITLLAGVPVIFLVAVGTGVLLGFHWLWVGYFLVCLALISYALGLFLAWGYVYFRDLKHVVGLVLQLWMFATPVLYPIDMMSAHAQNLLHLNPLCDIMVGLHQICAQSQSPSHLTICCAGLWALGFTFWGRYFVSSSIVGGVVEKL
jgi:ABC-type polysaccharide/polyol phosphate export permease